MVFCDGDVNNVCVSALSMLEEVAKSEAVSGENR